jgi:pyrimidine operon attenuation protein/uracil phosphoribosyltransferase
MNPEQGSSSCLYDSAEFGILLDRMALQAVQLLRGRDRIALIGILRRGAPLADQLAERLVRDHGLAHPLRLDLKVKRYADDLTLLHPDTELTEQAQHAALDLAGWTLLLVDDVLYTGHSLLRVLDYLARKRPAEVRVAVLADRCAATLPIHADVAGARLQIAPAGIIECQVPPYEPDWRIELLQPQ